MPKISQMEFVREWSEGFPVELHRHETSGRLVIRARSSGGNSVVDIDLWDLVDWCKVGAPTDAPKESDRGDNVA